MASGVKRPLVLSALCWVVFGSVLAAAYWLPVARWADGWAVEGFLNLQQPWLSHVAHHVAQLADPGPFAVWTALLVGVALYRRRPRHALAVLFLLGGANVTAQVLKSLLAQMRWHEFLGYAQLSAASFPSGHATASMALAFSAVLVAPAAWRPVVAVAGALFAVLVSESIMLLAWHFPSDVVGGFLVATSFTLFTVAALRFADQRWPEHSGRAAAKRVMHEVDVRRIGAVVSGFVLAALIGVAVAAGDRTLAFAGNHTTAVIAFVAVAAMAALLPVSVAALDSRRI